MAFVVVGDVHLEKKITKLFDEGHGLTLASSMTQVQTSLRAIERVFKWCRNKGVDTVVFAGDLFDTPYPKQSTVVALLALLRQFPKIRVIVIPGNHDLVSHEQHSLDTIDWIGKAEFMPLEVVLTPRTMKIDGHAVWVCPHPFVEKPTGGADWCIGHFAWAGARTDTGALSPATNRPKGRWLLGDFHTHQRGDRYIYAGSLTQLSRVEQGPKGFLSVEGDTAQFIPVQQDYYLRNHRLTALSELDTLDEDIDGVPVYWWIYLADDTLAMPKNWMTSYPHILDFTPASLDRASKDQTGEVIQFSDDPLEGLNEWVATQLPASRNKKREVKRVLTLASTINREKEKA